MKKENSIIIINFVVILIMLFVKIIYNIPIVYLMSLFLIPITIISYFEFDLSIFTTLFLNFTITYFFLENLKKYGFNHEVILIGIFQIFFSIYTLLMGFIFSKLKKEILVSRLYKNIMEISYERDNLDKFLDEIVKYTKDKFESKNCSIILIKKDKVIQKIISTENNINKELLEKNLKNESSLLNYILNGNNIYSNIASRDKRFNNYIDSLNRFISVPIKSGDEVIGIISIEDNIKNYTKRDVENLGNYGTVLGLAISNLNYYNKSLYDDLLDIPSKNYVDKKIKKVLADSKEKQILYTIIQLDLDNFKKINELYGSLNGDIVLVKAVKFIKSKLEKKDFIGRYGGNNFIIILENRGKYISKEILENIKDEFSNIEFNVKNDKVKLTFSAGVIAIPIDSVKTIREMKILLEQRMYKAKILGKNTIVEF
ncbi:diguanylate cyclase [Haliovirga abyssi]|uniref:GGDEF domain-containing protein n=1 Tax=Haliovirga abyssi TaxID=2996794 RepID=A0AAU9DKL6_9FUSO|nr:diguanylate cyclase [Haliovirga abyssi]BDU51464.1 GGDEF domain-containing protein [Haliovirga abyssi]